MKTFYTASKTKHAWKWRGLRKRGHNIISTWIDESEEGETSDFEDLAERCISEASEADITIIYCEEGEFLKGALLEARAALWAGKILRQVGDCQSISKVLANHNNWIKCDTLVEALEDDN